jgi:hypothetical protein
MGLDQYLYARVPASWGTSLYDVVEKHLTDDHRQQLAPDFGGAYASGWAFRDRQPEPLFVAIVEGTGFAATDDSPHALIHKADEGYQLDLCVGYWRKTNQVHAWFVEQCQDGVDECQISDAIDPSKLLELKELCEKVLADHSLADALLPTRPGFFFGDTAYDEWYFSDLKETVELLERVLTNPAARRDDVTFHYHSSW